MASTIGLGENASLGGFRPFPPTSAWNTPIDTLNVNSNSANWIANCSPASQSVLRLDFSMPYQVAPGSTPGMAPSAPCTYGCDPGPYRIPTNAIIEGTDATHPNGQGDMHMIVVDRDNLLSYEVFAFVWDPGMTSFTGGSGVVWNLAIDDMHPHSGADAAGLPIFPGLIRSDELIDAQKIEHALRFTCTTTYKGYIAPANASAGATTDPSFPPMGMRVRMKKDFDTSSYPASLQPLFTALKKYGLLLADNGGANTPWFITGADDPRLQQELANEWYVIRNVDVNVAMEVVDTGPVNPM